MNRIVNCSKFLAVALFATIMISGNSLVKAQEISPEHLAAAKRAIIATSATKKLNDILLAAVARLTGSMISSRPDIETEITAAVYDAALTLAPRRGDLEKEAAKIYANNFTKEELDKLADFFSTETGQKFLTALPIVVREIDAAARVWGTGINRDLAQAVAKKMKEAGHQ